MENLSCELLTIKTYTMKKIIIYVLFLTFLTACNDEVKISKNLDGDWQVERLESEVYTTTPNETRTFENIGTISFDHCGRSDRNDTPNNSCLGSYNVNLNNEDFVGSFTFSTDIRVDNNTSESTEYEWVNIGYSDGTFPSTADFNIFASWKIENLEDNNCTLINQHAGGFQRLYLKR